MKKLLISFFNLAVVVFLGIIIWRHTYIPWDVRENNQKYEVLEKNIWKEVQPISEVPKLEEFVDGSVSVSKYKKISPYKYFVEKRKDGRAEWVLWSTQDFEEAKKVFSK
jgi:hypothetical protein